jgi:hypothetical protein
MKGILSILASLIITFSLCTQFCGLKINALAEDTTTQTSYTYARSIVKTAYFFKDKDLSTSLFAVPYTYCVQIVRDDGDWYYVKYAEDSGIYKTLYGYCQKTDFTPLTTRPEVTYLYKSLTVTYKANDSSSTLPVLNELNVEAAFYGTYYSGATAYSYVLCQGSFGYISGANDDYPLNTIEEETKEEDQEETQSTTTNTDLITAVALSALAASALIILCITAKKHSSHKGE